jgi:hypothetical protein
LSPSCSCSYPKPGHQWDPLTGLSSSCSCSYPKPGHQWDPLTGLSSSCSCSYPKPGHQWDPLTGLSSSCSCSYPKPGHQSSSFLLTINWDERWLLKLLFLADFIRLQNCNVVWMTTDTIHIPRRHKSCERGNHG